MPTFRNSHPRARPLTVSLLSLTLAGFACRPASQDQGPESPAVHGPPIRAATTTPTPGNEIGEAQRAGQRSSSSVDTLPLELQRASPESDHSSRSTPSRSHSLVLEEARDSIRAVVGEPACADVSECRALPFGAKPCGGPRQFVIFSATKTDSVRLASALAQHKELDVRQNKRLGMASDCALVPRPMLECVLERCGAAPAYDTNRKPAP